MTPTKPWRTDSRLTPPFREPASPLSNSIQPSLKPFSICMRGSGFFIPCDLKSPSQESRGTIWRVACRLRPGPHGGILPSALAAFQKAVPRVKVVLHDLSSDELVAGLHDATLELAVMVQLTGEQTAGIEFELLRTYPWCVALSAAHPFARLKSISLEKVAAQPLVVLRRKDYSEYHRILERIFAPISAKPRIAVECDSASSVITRSGSRTRHRSGDHGPKTRGWQTPALPPAHRHDGSAVGRHRPRHKGRRDTRRREILRNLAENFIWRDCGKTKAGKVFLSELVRCCNAQTERQISAWS